MYYSVSAFGDDDAQVLKLFIIYKTWKVKKLKNPDNMANIGNLCGQDVSRYPGQS